MNYTLNSYVNRKEAESLKQMIFRRARERSEAMTDDVQADVMNIARESFVSNDNPFSQVLKTPASQETAPPETKETKEPTTSAIHEFVEKSEEQEQQVGFPQREQTPATMHQTRMIQEQLSARQVQSTMMEAREGLTNKKSFMGALAFLNSHAAVSLLNKRAGTGLDVVA